MKLLPFFMLAALTLSPAFSYANDETYVVTGSRFATPMNQIGYDVTVFTEEDIQNKQITTLDELLRYVPNITISEYGIGGASAFVRGADSSSLLILIDGVAINDPTQPSFDINSIAIGTAEKVEILLGAQTAMYGSGALAGVVNIITKEGDGALNGSVYLEGGYPLNGKLQAQANASSEKIAYALGLTGRYSNMMSATNENSGYYHNDDIDPFFDINFNGSVKYTASDMFNVRLSLNETYQDYAYDEGAVDGDTSATILRSLVSVKPELILFDGLWTQSLGLSYVFTDRLYYDDKYKSQELHADWQHRFALDIQNIALGVVYNLEQQIEYGYAYYAGEQEVDINNIAGYTEYSINPINSLYLNANGRVDYFDNLDDLALSGSLAIAYTLPTNTLLRTSLGKGFRAPSAYEYAQTPDLKPMNSFTWDIGATQKIADIAQVSLGYYQASYTHMITGWGPFFNAETERNSQGISASLTVNPIDALSLGLSGNYEMTDIDGKRPDQIPDYTVTFDTDYKLPVGNNALVGFTVKHVGDRQSSGSYTLDPYTLLNFRAQANVMDDLTLYLKVNNILNQEYEEIYGYSTLGINANLGVRYVF